VALESASCGTEEPSQQMRYQRQGGLMYSKVTRRIGGTRSNQRIERVEQLLVIARKFGPIGCRVQAFGALRRAWIRRSRV